MKSLSRAKLQQAREKIYYLGISNEVSINDVTKRGLNLFIIKSLPIQQNNYLNVILKEIQTFRSANMKRSKNRVKNLEKQTHLILYYLRVSLDHRNRFGACWGRSRSYRWHCWWRRCWGVCGKYDHVAYQDDAAEAEHRHYDDQDCVQLLVLFL